MIMTPVIYIVHLLSSSGFVLGPGNKLSWSLYSNLGETFTDKNEPWVNKSCNKPHLETITNTAYGLNEG